MGLLKKLVNNWVFLLGSLFVFALVLNREGDHVPTGNEFVYLLYFYKAWHHGFLASDWTFQETTAGHAVFNLTLGWLTRLPHITLEKAAWIGRVGSWIATFIALFRLGRHFKIPPLAVWAGILLWLLQRQSPVTREWMVGTFEAKVIAYPCLLFAIDVALSGNALIAGILCGIAFSYHTPVGMWGGTALGLTILIHQPIRKTLEFAGAAILFALPGLYTSRSLVMGAHKIHMDEARYLATVALPSCFDPAVFPLTWIIVLLILPTFTIAHALWKKEDRQIRMLMTFELALAVFFIFGLVSRYLGRYDWLELFPMRVYAVFALLLFFWQGLSVLCAIIEHKPYSRALAVYALFLLFCIPSPLLQLRDMLGSRLRKVIHRERVVIIDPAHGKSADFIAAARWVDQHAGQDDLVIAPPWPNEAFYYIRRPLIASWHAPRYDEIKEWRRRIEDLVGDTSNMKYEDIVSGEMDPHAWAHYAGLNAAFIQSLRSEGHSGKWLITTGHYDWPLRFSSDTYFVYELPAVANSPTAR